MQLGKALRAIGNCLACQVWHACRRLPTPALCHSLTLCTIANVLFKTHDLMFNGKIQGDSKVTPYFEILSIYSNPVICFSVFVCAFLNVWQLNLYSCFFSDLLCGIVFLSF